MFYYIQIMLTIKDDCNILKQHSLAPSLIVGTDEAGRGPLAGPVVAAGVLFHPDTEIEGIFDSKKIPLKKRNLLAVEIKEKALAYWIEIAGVELIEELNIYQASKHAMIQCFKNICCKIAPEKCNILLTDAMRISADELSGVNVIPIIKGDQKSFHIAAASILAKTARDEIMQNLHEEFPQYGWNKNMGYPTKAHREAIRQHGATAHHRKGFKLL